MYVNINLYFEDFPAVSGFSATIQVLKEKYRNGKLNIQLYTTILRN